MRAIDADALVEMFKTQYECETCDNYDGVRCRACHCDDALGIIDSAPTIDAVPVRRGEWVFVLESVRPFETEIEERCSLCGRYVQRVQRYGTQSQDNFCPNCGADMRQEERHE